MNGYRQVEAMLPPGQSMPPGQTTQEGYDADVLSNLYGSYRTGMEEREGPQMRAGQGNEMSWGMDKLNQIGAFAGGMRKTLLRKVMAPATIPMHLINKGASMLHGAIDPSQGTHGIYQDLSAKIDRYGEDPIRLIPGIDKMQEKLNKNHKGATAMGSLAGYYNPKEGPRKGETMMGGPGNGNNAGSATRPADTKVLEKRTIKNMRDWLVKVDSNRPGLMDL